MVVYRIGLPVARSLYHRLDDPRYLHGLVPDLATRDVYVCGPARFSAGVVAAPIG